MAAPVSFPLARSEGNMQRLSKLGGIAAILLGVALLADIIVFFAYVASSGVTIQGDNPAAQPAELARQLVNGAAAPFWIWHGVLAALAVLAFTMVQSLGDHLRAAGSRLPLQPLGAAALAIYVLIALVSATIERQAGSTVLTQSELEASIPVVFAVLIPVLLGSFNLLTAAWIFATSSAGWRTGAMPRWLSAVGAVTSLVLLAGVTGSAGIEVLAGPWLIITGGWMLAQARRT